MKFYFHGMNAGTEVEMEPGNLITCMKVDGSRFTGILLSWGFYANTFNQPPVFSILDESGVVVKINKDLIYWCEVLA